MFVLLCFSLFLLHDRTKITSRKNVFKNLLLILITASNHKKQQKEGKNTENIEVICEF